MQLGLVIGTATSTVKHPSMQGWKLLVVQFYENDGRKPDGEPVLAVDRLGAGFGDKVVLSSDGKVLYLGRIDNRIADIGQARNAATESDLRNALDSVLAGKPVAHPRTTAVGCAISLEK